MSASSKKKLRNEQEAAKMTERQLAEQKEAKKLKLYTTIFVVVIALLLVTAVTVGITQTINSSGMREKNTVALTVGSNEISNAELNYFYIDTVNNFYSQSGSYASMIGLDFTAPLNEQMMDETQSWADYLLESAKNTAISVYTMSDAAVAAGHTMTEAETANVDAAVSSAALYANIYGYPNAEAYLKAMYGNGASEEGYRAYVEKSMLADSYYAAYAESLTYSDAELRAAEEENYNAYSSYTYNQYYLSVNRFLEGGTTAEDGIVTYSDEENAAAAAACEDAAKALTREDITSAEALDAAISVLEINAGTTAASTAHVDAGYSSISSVVKDWVTDSSRKEGDLTYLKNSAIADDGSEVINGYYVVYYIGANTNEFALKNARHILVSFEGGTTDETGMTVYSDEEKAAAKTEAEAILAEFEAGSANEDSFAALASEKTDDTGSKETGGLYEDIYPGQMVSAFEDWCYDAARASGDTGIVETEYGYHVMYFVGDSDLTYRDYQITNDLRSEALDEWYVAVTTAAEIIEGDTKYLPLDMVLSRS